jgi:hypothetical protein
MDELYYRFRLLAEQLPEEHVVAGRPPVEPLVQQLAESPFFPREAGLAPARRTLASPV